MHFIFSMDNDHFLEKKNNFAGNNLLPLHYTEENLLKEYGTWPVKSVLFKNLTQVRSRKIKQDHVNNVWKMKMEGWIKELCLKITRSCITACLPSKMGGVDCTGYRSSLQIHILTCSFWELSFPVACSLLLAIYAKQNVTIHVIKWVIHQGRIVKFFFFFYRYNLYHHFLLLFVQHKELEMEENKPVFDCVMMKNLKIESAFL